MPPHRCEEKQFPCFDCKQMICAGCVKIDFNTLRCEACQDRVERVSALKNPASQNSANMKKRVGLGAASFFFSFVVLAALNMLTFCMT